MLTQDQLDAALAASPSPNRLTLDYLKSRIAAVDFHRPTGTLTLCVLTMKNGFTVTGESACADPANYNQEIGEKVAHDNAIEKLWPLEGYLLRERLHIKNADD